MKKHPLLTLLLLLTLISGCRFDQPEWDVDALVPVAVTSLTPENLFGDTLLSYNSDQSVNLRYDGDIYDIPVDTLLEIPDTGFLYNFSIPFQVDITGGTALDVYNNYIKFNVPNIVINYTEILSGQLALKVSSYIPRNVEITLTCEKALKNGLPLTLTDIVSPAQLPSPTVYTRLVDLSGYSFDLTGDDGTEGNRLRMKISCKVENGAPVYTAPPNQKLIDSEVRFVSTKPYYAKGAIKKQNLKISTDTALLDFMKIVRSGQLNLQDLSLKLTITNGVGADLQAYIAGLTGVNSRNGNIVSLTHPLIGSALNIDRAVDQHWQIPPFIPSSNEIIFTTGNSNVKQFVENLPDKIKFNGSFLINPLGNVSGANDFIYSSSKSGIRLTADAPLAFSFNQLILADTISYDLTNNVEASRVAYADVRIFAENKYPFECSLQTYTLNDVNQISDSLVTGGIIPAASIGPDLKVTGPVNTILNITLADQKKSNFLNSKKIFFKVRFHTPTGQILTVYSGYTLNLKLVASFRYRI
jgi:hypothetical protein